MLTRYAHLAPVPLRLALGIVFVVHGVPKVLATTSITPFFAKIGLPAPSAMVILIGAIEIISGLLVLAGYGIRVAAALLALTMVGAIGLVKARAGFVNGWEFDFVLLAAALSLLLSGPLGHPGTSDPNEDA